MSTSICGYRGLVVALSCASAATGHKYCNHPQVRVCLGGGMYQFISSKGETNPTEIHNIQAVAGTLSLSPTRNCTKAEARFLGFDVDRKPKGPGEYVVFFQEQEEILQFDGTKRMYYGVYKLVNFMKVSGNFGLDPVLRTNPFPDKCMPSYIGMDVKKTVMVIDAKEIGL